MHQMVKSASGIICGISWELKGDTSRSCTKKLITGQLTKMIGGGGRFYERIRKRKNPWRQSIYDGRNI